VTARDEERPEQPRRERVVRPTTTRVRLSEDQPDPPSILGWLFVAAAVWLCLAAPVGWLAAQGAFSWGRTLIALPLGMLLWLVATACCATLDGRGKTNAMGAFQGLWFALSIACFALSEGWRWVALLNGLALVGFAGWTLLTARVKT
jgi:hypothetical protein